MGTMIIPQYSSALWPSNNRSCYSLLPCIVYPSQLYFESKNLSGRFIKFNRWRARLMEKFEKYSIFWLTIMVGFN